MPAWVIPTLSALLTAVGALVAVLLGVVIDEMRDAQAERQDMEIRMTRVEAACERTEAP